MDRNFAAYDLLYDLYERGVDFLVRVKASMKSTVVARLGPGVG